MNIDSAEKSIRKLHAYVKDLADNKPKMYQKSRTRLKELAEVSKDIVVLLSDILQDEALAEDTVEFGSDASITSVLDYMQNQINQIRNFTGGNTSKSVKQEKSSTGSGSKKQTMRDYRTVMEKISEVDFKYDCVSRCAKLLWDWFNARFIITVHNTGFKYNMKRFPIWIRNIVVMYGRAIRDNNYLEFDTKFHIWIANLVDNPNVENNYAIPYDVYEFEKSMQPGDMSLEAVVLWDILVDGGLSELCTKIKDDLYLSDDSVYNLCSEKNPSVLDSYANYVDHPEILSTLGWEVINA